MSGSITTQRGYEWSEAPQELISALRLTAKPVARIDEGAVGARELVDAAVVTIAGTVTPPVHLSFTVPADVPVAQHTTVDVASIGGTYTLDEIVMIDQPSILLNVHAYVSSVSAIKIIARNTANVDTIVPLGMVFKMVRI